MIKFDLSPSLLAPATNVESKSTQRLIVLVPYDADYSAATRRIWELANATRMHVQLLALCKDTSEEPELRRRLVTMASLLQDGKLSVEVEVTIGTNWVMAVKNHYKPGDTIVCFAEQSAGFLHRPLSQTLESDLHATMYIFSGLSSQEPRSNNWSWISAWLGFIGIIAGFGVLQASIVQSPEGWLQTTLLILSILPEFWLIWVWNGMFS